MTDGPFDSGKRKIRESEKDQRTRKHSSRMQTDQDVTRPTSEPVSMRPIVDRQTPVKTLPSLAVGNNRKRSKKKFKYQRKFSLSRSLSLGVNGA